MALKTIMFNGKRYSYRESDVKYFEKYKFLDRTDSIEQAINKQLARERMRRLKN